MSKQYRGVLVGCGYVAPFHLGAWSRIEGVEIVGVADLDGEKARLTAEEFGVGGIWEDYREMVEKESPDFVDIATPPSTHLEMVRYAAERSLAVLCQKPIAATMGELREMIRVSDEAGVLFVVNENGRFQPWFRKMKALIEEGAIGEPYYANLSGRGRNSLPVAQFGGQGFFARMPRLVIYELGVHYLDTLRYLFGEATSLYTRAKRVSPYIAGEDVATILLAMGGVTAVVDMSWASVPVSKPKEAVSWGEYRVEGTAGTLHVDQEGVLRLLRDDGEESFSFPSDSILLGFEAAQRHFADCLRGEAASETSGRETLKTMELVFGAYESWANDRIYVVGDDLSRLD